MTYIKPYCSDCNTSVTVASPQSTVNETTCCNTPPTTQVCSSCKKLPQNCTCKYVLDPCSPAGGKVVCKCTTPNCTCVQKTTPCVQKPATCGCTQPTLTRPNYYPNRCSCVTQSICDENHCQDQACSCATKFYVTSKSSFTMPDCGNNGELFLDSSEGLFVGAILFAQSYGYLTVMDVRDCGSVIVKNECLSCNSIDPADPIPEGTVFGVGIPSCSSGSSSTQDGVYLAADFIIPQVGIDCCVQMKVTRLGNITTNSVISVNGYQYTVQSVTDTETIVVCNEGLGGTAGTVIKADPNCDGIYDYPIDVISAPSPCSQDPVTSGQVVVCDGTELTTIQGILDGQILVWNEGLGKFVLEVLNSETIDCTTLTSCLILDPENIDQTYVINVADSSIFEKPEYDQFQNLLIYINGDPFTLVDIISSTQIRVSPFFEVTEVKEYAANVTICIAECCAQCRPTVETLGRFGGTEGEPVEILVPQNDPGFTIPDGISVRNYFVLGGAGTTNPLLYDPTEEGLWMIDYTNEGQCKKYFELKSNIEMVLHMPTGVLGNAEYRIHNSRGSTQAFYGAPLIGNDATYIADPDDVGGQTGNLSIAGPPIYKDLNTLKGVVFDRDFIDPGENVKFYGHIRLTFVNTTGQEQTCDFTSGMRVWYTAWDYELGPEFGV